MHNIYVQFTTHTHSWSQYAAITPNLSMSTDTIESFLLIFSQALYILPDDGSSVIRNMLEHF